MGKDSGGLEVLLKPAFAVGSFICSLPSRVVDGLDAWTEALNNEGSEMEYKYQSRILNNYQPPPGRIVLEKGVKLAFTASILSAVYIAADQLSKYL